LRDPLAQHRLIAGCHQPIIAPAKCHSAKCPLSGAKRTCLFALQMSAYDPKQKYGETFQVSRESVSFTDMKTGINILGTLQFRLVRHMSRLQRPAQQRLLDHIIV
jgi:hypothetical protein